MTYDRENRHFSEEIDKGGRNWTQSLLSWIFVPTTLFVLPLTFARLVWDADPWWSELAAVYFAVSGVLLLVWSLYLFGVPRIGGRWTAAMPIFLVVTYSLAGLVAWTIWGALGLALLLTAAAIALASLLGALG
ncbi:hypothetical protein PB2503_09269 [Parvularcula bermudensis HTCC2503]|uniref:Uncharacterized protein n=1 Tax=Parvularcula bermudensis (strain ATCC BAA-594 / HTCC2503 / KCTC 12087) TaxID=314260 RepID=E0TD84_PARBH|nr:hypothetical protein [Parvularcula bermudensis]ADM09907.1 hypothetical protein PB2503_09269 [Parvularcula bermudensis HTCC2503]